MVDSAADVDGVGTVEPYSTATWSPLSRDDEDLKHQPLMKRTWIMSLFIFFYSVIFLLGIVGNVVVVVVVVKNKAMQTVTNIFIASLAVADLCLCLLNVPFTPMVYFTESWIFGEALCHVLSLTIFVIAHVSTFTSTAIAVDRYLVIVHPFQPRMNVCLCLVMIVVIWLFSVTVCLPVGFNQKYQQAHDSTTFSCYETWPSRLSRQFFTVTSFLLQYAVPLIVITFCYSVIWQTLQKRSKMRIGSGVQSRQREEQSLARKKRTNRMLIAMVLIFISCWLPHNVTMLLVEFNESFERWYYTPLLFFINHVLAMSSTVYNPFLYAWMNDNFRREFQRVLPCLFRGGRQAQRNSMHSGVEAPPPSPCPRRSPARSSPCSTVHL